MVRYLLLLAFLSSSSHLFAAQQTKKQQSLETLKHANDQVVQLNHDINGYATAYGLMNQKAAFDELATYIIGELSKKDFNKEQLAQTLKAKVEEHKKTKDDEMETLREATTKMQDRYKSVSSALGIMLTKTAKEYAL